MKDRTKKLIKIGGLAAALALIGGTFAFTNFGQRVLNITEDTNRPTHGARVHDYFQDDAATANKDVFVENFGTQPVIARVKLTELFMRNGLPVNANGQLISEENPATFDVDDPDDWPVFRPAVDESVTADDDPDFGALGRRIAGDNAYLNNYFHLQLGQSTNGDERPWYMPTFNFDPQNNETAAAGRAIDGEVGGITHPGEGTDGFWESGDTAFALPEMLEDPHNHSNEEHVAAQVLNQDRRPVTLEQWAEMPEEEQVGNFWVFDQVTGWAYWADFLGGATPGSAAGGQATSFLVDNKVRQNNSQTGLPSIRQDWSYKLHVIGGFAGATEVDDVVNSFQGIDGIENQTAMRALVAAIFAANDDATS